MTTIEATTVLRSRNSKSGDVLSTLLLRYPRWIHAELMTHRVFSRNSASSRAIPVKKLIQDVIDNPAVPLFWGKNQPGMQANEEIDSFVETWKLKTIYDEDDSIAGTIPSLSKLKYTNEEAWLNARDFAVHFAQAFADSGYHKQIVNRLLEPFAHITVLVSSTEWDNFLALRDHKDAEPHIQMLAREVKRCLDNDPIQELLPGEYHLPFLREDDMILDNETKITLSMAMCASTSYKTVDGFDMSFEKANSIYNKLLLNEPIHASPSEHVAYADDFDILSINGVEWIEWNTPEGHRNFTGFVQQRYLIGA